MQQINRQMDAWWDERFATGDVDIKRESERGEEEFLADTEFCQMVAKLYIRQILYQRGIDMAGRRRSLIREEGKAIAKATPIVPLPALEQRAPEAPPRSPAVSARPDPIPTVAPSPAPSPEPSRQIPSIPIRTEMTRSWSEWLERDPETGHHVSLKTFVKPKLLKKSREYYERGGAAIQTGAMLALIAGRIPDDTTPMGDVLTDHDLNLITGNLTVGLRATIGLTGIAGSLTWEALLS